MRAGVHPCGSQPLREKRLPPRKVHLLAFRRSKVGCACYLCARQAKWHLHCAGIYMPSTRTTQICQLKTNVPAANQHKRREGRAKRSVELREFKYRHSRKVVRKIERRELDTNVLRG